LSMINLSMDKYVLSFEGSNYPSYDSYIDKYIKLPILPVHMGEYVLAKVTRVHQYELSVKFYTDSGEFIYSQKKMPDAYTTL